MFEFCVLSSGSKANCIYVRSGETHVLVDCGLSARETVRRLESIGVALDQLSAIVVTHEHTDHVAGIPVFLKRRQVPVFANSATFHASRQLSLVPPELRRTFQAGESFEIGDLVLEPFSVLHDASDPVAFRVRAGERALGIVTDLGQVTGLVRERTKELDAIVLETNHDPVLLQECPYPWELKQRISGRSGHLSNETAAELLEHLHNGSTRALQVVIAAHISENSNDPVLAVDALKNAYAKAVGERPEFLAANPYAPTPVYRIS